MKLILPAMAAWLLLTGCAGNKPTYAEHAALVDSYIQTNQLESKSRITTFQLDSWHDLGEQHLILRTSPFKPYLVKLKARCPNLTFAHTLGTDQSMDNSLSANFDAVFVPDYPHLKCHIESIYPISREQAKELMALDDMKPDEESFKPAAIDTDTDENTN
ncbi:DUF6491 family protein [Bowmanella dokdonensis]|uniref:Lipoprotein n=1 Tax=Bowmanella dokdonensis TaxID=751969 RepID=A0A939IMF7_9ALTE|nr:DUF6491 family protein [Bowmanella dokdonensis]MBN7825268.1 hypothetical protein [Bowmanella dokdonensis]